VDQFGQMAWLLATGCCIAEAQLADQCVGSGERDALATEPTVKVAASAAAVAAITVMTVAGRMLISFSWYWVRDGSSHACS
jgi:hypothetical protein